MMQQEISLQDLVRQNGPLNAGMAAAYVSQIADELQQMHTVRHICHLDVRPATIVITSGGRATLKASTVSQSYSEEGATTDQRDLKATHHYLLTGRQEQADPSHGTEVTREVPYTTTTPKAKKPLWPWLTAIVACVAAALLVVFLLKHHEQKSSLQGEDGQGPRSYADFTWQGPWKGEVPHGRGTARYHDGRCYTGLMEQGIRKDKNAQFTYTDGNQFTGEFAADTIRQGRVTLASGDYYFVGKFSGGAPYEGYWYRTADNRKVEHVEKGKETLL